METLTEILGLSVHDMGNDMEKTIEQHRAEFEEWAKQSCFNLETSTIGRYKEYVSTHTRIAWVSWKAARGIKEAGNE